MEREIDPLINIPYNLREKTHTQPKINLKAAKFLRAGWKNLNRYKKKA